MADKKSFIRVPFIKLITGRIKPRKEKGYTKKKQVRNPRKKKNEPSNRNKV